MSAPTPPKRPRGRPPSFPFDEHGLDATPDQIARAILRGERPRKRKRRTAGK